MTAVEFLNSIGGLGIDGEVSKQFQRILAKQGKTIAYTVICNLLFYNCRVVLQKCIVDARLIGAYVLLSGISKPILMLTLQ